LSPVEGILQWYLWAIKELNMSYETVEKMPVEELFDMVLLTDKFNHPQDYEPAENVFRMFM